MLPIAGASDCRWERDSSPAFRRPASPDSLALFASEIDPARDIATDTRLIESVRSSGAWVATAGDAVAWFDARRRIRFEHDAHADDVRVRHDDERAAVPGFTVRVHRPAGESAARSVVDRSWDGRSVVSVGPLATCSLS